MSKKIKVTPQSAKPKRQKKEPIFCYWADVKYSIGAIHVQNGREYMCNYKGH